QAMVLNRLGLDDGSGNHEGDLSTLAASSPGQDENGSQLIPPLVSEPSENSPASSSASKRKDKVSEYAPAAALPPSSNGTKPPESKESRARGRRPPAVAARAADSVLPGLAPVPEGTPAPVEPPAPLATFREREAPPAVPVRAEPGDDGSSRETVKNQVPD